MFVVVTGAVASAEAAAADNGALTTVEDAEDTVDMAVMVDVSERADTLFAV